MTYQHHFTVSEVATGWLAYNMIDIAIEFPQFQRAITLPHPASVCE